VMVVVTVIRFCNSSHIIRRNVDLTVCSENTATLWIPTHLVSCCTSNLL
jgi:hypothetical protein